MRIAVVGTGYVGLVSGASFAKLGHSVVCIDTNKSKIDQLKRGRVPIFEPGLDELVRQGAAARRLTFTSDAKSGLKQAQVVFICVGTPLGQHGGLGGPVVCVRGGRHDRDAPAWLYGRGNKIDRSRRYRRGDRVDHPQGGPGGRFCRGLESGVFT